MFDAVADRLAASVTDLSGRIEPGAKLSEMIARNQMPQNTPAAFVLPLGLRGGRSEAATGIFRQTISDTLGIVLVVRSAGDATGAKASDRLTPLRNDVIRCICGWAPPSDWLSGETIGVFTLSRGELISLSAGTLIYQLDFAIDDQLRISP
tara:strand:+ start:10743 stop:11195 length:453 start_codon:yes stop_codon:yes gene_type:complete